MNCRPTLRAEMDGNSATLIADPNKLRRATADEYIPAKKAGLRTEYAAGAALAGEAMADRNSNWFAGRFGSKLPAATRGSTHFVFNSG